MTRARTATPARLGAFFALVALAFVAVTGVTAVTGGAGGVGTARAEQPAPVRVDRNRDPHAGHDHGPGGHGDHGRTDHGIGHGIGDAPESLNRNSPATVIVFWLFALALVAGSIFVITRRNLITAVMGMVGTFFSIAVVYAMLYAHFLAAIQVLVYAGAIMVLFVFVIMILNRPEVEPWSRTNLIGKVVVVGVTLYVVYRLISVLWGIEPPPGSYTAPLAPSATGDPNLIDAPDWGSTKSVGRSLFTNYLFPFEAVSIVLLVAVVGAVAVARPHERRPGTLPAGVRDAPRAGGPANS